MLIILAGRYYIYNKTMYFQGNQSYQDISQYLNEWNT